MFFFSLSSIYIVYAPAHAGFFPPKITLFLSLARFPLCLILHLCQTLLSHAAPVLPLELAIFPLACVYLENVRGALLKLARERIVIGDFLIRAVDAKKYLEISELRRVLFARCKNRI